MAIVDGGMLKQMEAALEILTQHEYLIRQALESYQDDCATASDAFLKQYNEVKGDAVKEVDQDRSVISTKGLKELADHAADRAKKAREAIDALTKFSIGDYDKED